MFIFDNTNILCDAQHITCLYHRNKVVGTTILQYSSESLLHSVAFFNVASLFVIGVEKRKVGVDNRKGGADKWNDFLIIWPV